MTGLVLWSSPPRTDTRTSSSARSLSIHSEKIISRKQTEKPHSPFISSRWGLCRRVSVHVIRSMGWGFSVCPPTCIDSLLMTFLFLVCANIFLVSLLYGNIVGFCWLWRVRSKHFVHASFILFSSFFLLLLLLFICRSSSSMCKALFIHNSGSL